VIKGELQALPLSGFIKKILSYPAPLSESLINVLPLDVRQKMIVYGYLRE
jgi:hypothetical protein